MPLQPDRLHLRGQPGKAPRAEGALGRLFARALYYTTSVVVPLTPLPPRSPTESGGMQDAGAVRSTTSPPPRTAGRGWGEGRTTLTAERLLYYTTSAVGVVCPARLPFGGILWRPPRVPITPTPRPFQG